MNDFQVVKIEEIKRELANARREQQLGKALLPFAPQQVGILFWIPPIEAEQHRQDDDATQLRRA